MADGDVPVGVATVGRPVARLIDDDHTPEVARVTVADGASNACSVLYGAARRAAKALGYRRLVIHTQAGESGASLRRPDGASWPPDHPPLAGSRPSRPRADHGVDGIARTRWHAPD